MKKKSILVAAIAVMLVAALVVGGTLAYFTDTKSVTNTFTVGNVAIDLKEPSWTADADHTLVPGKFYAKDPTITVDAKSQDAYVFLKLDLNKYVSLINLMGVDAYKNNIGGLGDPNGPYTTYPTYPGFMRFVEMLAKDNTLRATVLGRWFKGINHADWQVMNTTEIEQAVMGAANGTNPANLVVVLGYKGGKDGVVSAGTEIKFMDQFGMPETVTASMFDGEDAYYFGDHSASNFNTKNGDFKMIFTAYAIQADQINGLNAAYAALFTK